MNEHNPTPNTKTNQPLTVLKKVGDGPAVQMPFAIAIGELVKSRYGQVYRREQIGSFLRAGTSLRVGDARYSLKRNDVEGIHVLTPILTHEKPRPRSTGKLGEQVFNEIRKQLGAR